MACNSERMPLTPHFYFHGAQDPRSNFARNLLELCSSHPLGMGYICTDDGQIVPQLPLTPLYIGDHPFPSSSNYIREACLGTCICEPDAPEPVDHNVPHTCSEAITDPVEGAPEAVVNDTASSSGQCVVNSPVTPSENPPWAPEGLWAAELGSGPYLPELDPQITCDAGIYGHPENSDCERAISIIKARQEMYPGLRDHPQTYEFLEQGAQPYDDGDSSFHIVRLPLTITYGERRRATKGKIG